jgi:hypothetical protein
VLTLCGCAGIEAVHRWSRRRPPELAIPSMFWCSATIRIAGDTTAAPRTSLSKERPMELAAIVLFSSVVLWFVQEATTDHR